MSFEILSALATTTLPTEVEFTSGVVPANLGDVQVEAAPNLDASGGSLAIETVIGEDGAEQTSLVYTDVAGAMTRSPIDLPEGLVLAQSNPVVFGEELDSFVLLAGEFTTPTPTTVFSAFSLIDVTIAEDGTPELGAVRDVFEGFRIHDFELDAGVYPLGDGTLGYAFGDSDNDFGMQFGIVTEEGDDLLATSLGGGLFVGSGIILLDDGGMLLVETFAGEAQEFGLRQLDAAGEAVMTGNIDLTQLLADQGLAIEAPFVSLALTDAGELEVFVSDAAAQDGEVYGLTLDLAPESDVIEPPLPPVEDGDPTEGDDVIEVFGEGDRVFALGGDDTITVLGPESTVFGGAGDDTFDVAAPNSKVYGDEGSDSFIVDGPDSTVFGGAGDDTIETGGALDFEAFGGDGQDWIIGGEGNDSIDGGDGDDVTTNLGRIDPLVGGLFGGVGDDSINGRGGADWISGDAGNDDLRGGDGDDGGFYSLDGNQSAGLSGGAGSDFMRGNHGDDELRGGDGNDDMNGGFGNDVVIGDAGNDKVSGFDGDDQLFGGLGNDVLHGGRGDDLLEGSNGEDVLRGAQGNDTLMGERGDDQLIGGEGADVFHYEYFRFQGTFEEGGIEFPNLARVQDNGTDTIKDFTIGEDKISIESEFIAFANPEESFELEERTALTFDDIFLSQEDSYAIIQAGDTTIRLKGVDVDDLSEDDFLLG